MGSYFTSISLKILRFIFQLHSALTVERHWTKRLHFFVPWIALNKEAIRILRLLGNTEVKHINTTVGPEQEYFLVDKDLYNKRKDLIFCGRTLIGAPAPKGQEMEDHYFGAPEASCFRLYA